MALIFFGTPQFAVPSLQCLLDSGEDVRLVVTQPDKVKGRGHVPSSPPVKELAESRGIPVAQPAGIRGDEFLSQLTAIQPEFIIVVAYGKILPEQVLNLPLRGCINVHASLLPKYRGAAPIQWALINGEAETGVTTMLMDKGLDTGDILLQKGLKIQAEDNAGTLAVKLSELGANTLLETILSVRNGDLKPTLQTGEWNYAPTMKKEDGKTDWNRTARELVHFVKGMYPWPAAFCFLGKERIKITNAHQSEGSGVPGRILLSSAGELTVATQNGLLVIDELQPEGKKNMSGKAFAAGRRLKGDEFFS